MMLEKLINCLDKIYHHKRITKFLNKYQISLLIDIGAHKGEFIKNFLKGKNKLKKIYAFEPQENIFQILENRFKNDKKIKKFQNALDWKIGKKTLFINKLSSTSTLSKTNENSYFLKLKNILTNSKDFYVNKYKVKTITLDYFLKNKNLKNTLLKIDVEGNEYNVLKGAKKVIKEIDFILIERHFFSIHKNYNYSLSHNLLLKNKFELVKNFKFPLLNFEDKLYINTSIYKKRMI